MPAERPATWTSELRRLEREYDEAKHAACAAFIMTKYGTFTRESIERLFEAARDLYEQVEMDESVGVCLTDRTPSMILGELMHE